MKALLGAFNQEKALVGTFSVIVQLHRLIVYRVSCCCQGESFPRPAAVVKQNLVLAQGEAEIQAPAPGPNYRSG